MAGPPDEANPTGRTMRDILEKAARDNGLVAAFAVVGLVVMISEFLARKLTSGACARLRHRDPHRPRDGVCRGQTQRRNEGASQTSLCSAGSV